MPYCITTPGDAAGNNGIKIFYKTYGRGPTKVLLIIGLAGTHDSWGPQIKGLTGSDISNDGVSMSGCDGNANEISGNDSNAAGVEVCAFDNRGMGRSSVPTKRSEYTTTIMAKDAIALMDHLGWSKSHVFGHSMGWFTDSVATLPLANCNCAGGVEGNLRGCDGPKGCGNWVWVVSRVLDCINSGSCVGGMIACKLGAMVPDRVLSLALLNVTGGGFQCLPKFDRLTMSIAVRFMMAKTPEERAAVDLDTHYSQDYLEELVGSSKRRTILYREYVKGISSTGMQSNHGFEGQVNACWTHKVTQKEIESLRSGGFLISVIHGRFDVIAQVSHARKLAEKLYPNAKMVDLHGGHLVSHERTKEVNDELWELIRASEAKVSALDWTNLPDKSPGFRGSWTLIGGTNATIARSGLSYTYYGLERLNRFFIYLFGLFVLFFEYVRRAVRNLKPVRVGSSIPCEMAT